MRKFIKLLNSGDEIRNLIGVDLDFKAGLFPLPFADFEVGIEFQQVVGRRMLKAEGMARASHEDRIVWSVAVMDLENWKWKIRLER